jgi:23S rRNA (adenine2503-C2)-methyltransferase
MQRLNLKEAAMEDLLGLVEALGEKPYRARQIAHWVYQKGASSLDGMTTLSRSFRQRLKEAVELPALEVIKHQEAPDGTIKYLFGLPDGEAIETVLIPEPPRLTLCLSTQVGCRLGCKFCRTAEMGLRRNLQCWEIVDQYLACRFRLGHPVTHLVYMGMGEPLDNYQAVVRSLRILTEPELGQLSPRRLTLSTVGLIKGIRALAGEGLGINLAVSLAATTNEARSRLTPVGRRYPLEELFRALRDYPLAPRRRLTIEYVLLGGLNDSLEDARRLARWLKGLRCKINVIPFNPYPDSEFEPPGPERLDAFVEALAARGLTTTVRKSRGADILAACGQLSLSNFGKTD